MSVPELLAPGPEQKRVTARVDVAAEARDLVAGLVAAPWGQVSASVYETGRLVSAAPWLSGHAGRVRFLLDSQRPDGGWGTPGGYALVPTLSATEALLAELRRRASARPAGIERGVTRDAELLPGPSSHVLAEATARGLRMLERWSGEETRASLPDMPAIELIVPTLTSMINTHLFPGGERLETPAGMDGVKLAAIREWLASGAAVPQKLVHALEVIGEVASEAAGVSPVPVGVARFVPEEATGDDGPTTALPPEPIAAVGASPAAAVAWLGTRGATEPDDPVLRYLEEVVGRSGGPVPCATPITVFERGWALSWLLRAGVTPVVPASLTASLREALGSGSSAAGPGLPPDADTTSVAFYALALLGSPLEPAGLWAYETGTHFCTWEGEEGASPTVNAHVLDAFGEYLRRGPGIPDPRYAEAVRKLSTWLRDQQEADGSWLDRWHASPYYATACCAIALADFGGEESAVAVRAAERWVLDTQCQDGSWGRWGGTAEETAYALQTLLLAAGPLTRHDDARAAALERGHRYLLASVTDRGESVDASPLWHDKDLYLPVAIVRAAVLGALHLVHQALSSTARRPARSDAPTL
ncbi:prenyltransferase/squalene oxidase repeat-containing protein [Streptosporangium amethystogenes]|uniref:prenyltransferase/squalene oxidase repeat-containing protein n=1 Tax=Streptosporangium amethystogenes TaxID=2002 RepID=UPI000A942481|nr:prenyltransferase/squalene oxidase repeat-containing protein [Streptosporangium amethystogenes]